MTVLHEYLIKGWINPHVLSHHFWETFSYIQKRGNHPTSITVIIYCYTLHMLFLKIGLSQYICSYIFAIIWPWITQGRAYVLFIFISHCLACYLKGKSKCLYKFLLTFWVDYFPCFPPNYYAVCLIFVWWQRGGQTVTLRHTIQSFCVAIILSSFQTAKNALTIRGQLTCPVISL